MRKTVCPYCDQPIKGHYCAGCRRFVKNPVETETDYYLNERHPRGEHECEYHDDHDRRGYRLSQSEVEAKKAEIRERMTAQRREKASSSPSYESQMPRSAAKSSAEMAGTKKNTKPKTRKGRWKLILIIYLILVFGGTLFGCIAEFVSDIVSSTQYGISMVIPEPEPESEFDDWERTDEEVIEAGERCNGYAHFPVECPDVEDKFLEYMENCGFTVDMDRRSRNQVIDDYTAFHTTFDCMLTGDEDYLGTAELDVDTATKEIHSLCVYANEKEEFLRILDAALGFMEEVGLSEELPDAAAFYEASMADADEYGFSRMTAYGMSVSGYEDEEFFQILMEPEEE